jgi:hypothetical protein
MRPANELHVAERTKQEVLSAAATEDLMAVPTASDDPHSAILKPNHAPSISRDFPVNSNPSFTGNCGPFAEYRVNTCGIRLKISPWIGDYHLLRRHT